MKSRIIKGISARQHQPVQPKPSVVKAVGLRYTQEDVYLDTPGHIMQPPIVDPATGHDITEVTLVQPDGSLGFLRVGRGAFEQLSDLVSRMELNASAAADAEAALQAMPRTAAALREAVQRASRASELYQRMSGRSLRSLRWSDNDRAEEAASRALEQLEAEQRMTRLAAPQRRQRARTCQGCIHNRGSQGDQTFCGEKSRCVANERCPSYRSNTPNSSAQRRSQRRGSR